MTKVIPFLASFSLDFANLYVILLTIRLALGWFPMIDWCEQPFYTLQRMTMPYFTLFRGIAPQMGSVDFSPLLGILAVQWIISILNNIVSNSL
ncbi:hypothetical chloroplast RF19 (plastid) [Cryptomonas paramecium]|uniref:Hypothetical chloroplast RF19 n=1 Tax=Cryptomonas paramaecium TaxID=2898 RepID=D2ISD6_9CRYP|nr:hypothetical chloroplast RF19 [Cryptomonas paramecium]ACT46828.1 hypothetical chloroplast RF19 [Cryptomonas paramecium]BDA97967.1 hypothetical protein [Cryptomonas paramecium]|mmetsp:Transcript_28511/g.75132  ORF Transcript_28511/g.75132 Transcript_28511/m.75132 type:complete len:93 (+) Transcript_28511:445-723(+)